MILVGMIVLVGLSAIGIYVWNERVRVAQRADEFPYIKRKYLCNRDERTFFRYLVKAISRDYLILTKVRMADILTVDRALTDKKRFEFFEKIAPRHVDFVLVDRATTEIKMVVDLFNDRVSNTKLVQKAIFMDKLFQAAGIPLMRFRLSENYSIADLKKAISDAEQRVTGQSEVPTYAAPSLRAHAREMSAAAGTSGNSGSRRRARRLSRDTDNERLLGAQSKALSAPSDNAGVPSRIKVA